MARTGRASWSSGLGFVLAAAGSAVGLGNVWKFPYMAGRNGGGAFILAYVGCVLAVGVPIMLAEFLIGRRTRRNPVGAFRQLRPRTAWVGVGWLGIATGFVILSYYSVVGGWVLYYLQLAARGAFDGGASEVEELFVALTRSSRLQILWHAVFMCFTATIVAGGVRRGLERANEIMMPALLFLVTALIVYGLRLPGAAAGLEFMLRPRFGELSPHSLLEALGQAFFSLSLGMGALMTYGSYLPGRTNLARSGLAVALADTGIALLMGLLVFPLVFSFGLEPAAGPGLIFRTLPLAFARLAGGSLVAGVFFLLVAFAALTSAISLLEVVVAYLVDEWGWTRIRASWLAASCVFVLGIPSAASAATLGFMDGLASNYMLPAGGILIAVFTAWILGESERADEFGAAGKDHLLHYRVWLVLLRYVSPTAVVVIFLRRLGLF